MTIFDALELLVHKKLLVIRNSICFYYQIARSKSFKRLRLGKTTGWQHRFFDLIILSPILRLLGAGKGFLNVQVFALANSP